MQFRDAQPSPPSNDPTVDPAHAGPGLRASEDFDGDFDFDFDADDDDDDDDDDEVDDDEDEDEDEDEEEDDAIPLDELDADED